MVNWEYQVQNFAYFYRQFTPWTTSALFTTGNKDIRIFKYDHIKEIFQKLKNQFKKFILKILLLYNHFKY